MHAYMHTCIHTYVNKYIHTYITYIHTYIHTCIHTCMHACIHTYIHNSPEVGAFKWSLRELRENFNERGVGLSSRTPAVLAAAFGCF